VLFVSKGLKELSASEKTAATNPGSEAAPGSNTGSTVVKLVIGGYISGPHGLDSIIVGYYKDDDLIYVAPSPEWLCAGFAAAGVREAAASCDSRMSVRQSA